MKAEQANANEGRFGQRFAERVFAFVCTLEVEEMVIYHDALDNTGHHRKVGMRSS
jgi:hypothetical protein